MTAENENPASRESLRVYNPAPIQRQEHGEGSFTRMIEQQTAKVPSPIFLVAAMASMLASFSFEITGQSETEPLRRHVGADPAHHGGLQQARENARAALNGGSLHAHAKAGEGRGSERLMPAAEGSGPLLQRDYWAVIACCRTSPAGLIDILRYKFCELAPPQLARFRRLQAPRRAAADRR